MTRAVFTVSAWLFLCVACCLAATVDDYAEKIAPLINPTKLATLGVRGANPRVQKYVFQLATAKQEGLEVRSVVWKAVALAGYTNAAPAELTRAAMLRNLDIATKLGCLDAEGLAEMKKGNAPTVRRGNYVGDQLSVDHIIPRAVCPELDNVIANLELMPGRMNSQKNAKVGRRQRSYAEKLTKAGLLSAEGLKAVKNSK